MHALAQVQLYPTSAETQAMQLLPNSVCALVLGSAVIFTAWRYTNWLDFLPMVCCAYRAAGQRDVAGSEELIEDGQAAEPDAPSPNRKLLSACITISVLRQAMAFHNEGAWILPLPMQIKLTYQQ